MARVVDSAGDELTQSDVSSITYAVYLLAEDDDSNRSAVAGYSGSLVVVDSIYDTLQTDPAWTADAVGYNFRHVLPGGALALPGRSYVVRFSVTTSDAVLALEFFLDTTPAVAVEGGYCKRSDIQDIYGSDNVRKWADIDNNGDWDAIASRIATAINTVTSLIDDALRNGPYELPFSPVPTGIKHLTAQWAGVWLYESRGVQDFDETTGAPRHRLAWNRDYVERSLKELLAAKKVLSATRAGTSCPMVLKRG